MKRMFLKALMLLSLVSVFATEHALAQAKNNYPDVSSFCTETRFQDYINLVNTMRDYVAPAEYAAVYLPIKIKAAKAKIAIKVNGSLSMKTQRAVLDLVDFVSNNEDQLTHLWEVEILFDTAMDLSELTQSLSRELY